MSSWRIAFNLSVLCLFIITQMILTANTLDVPDSLKAQAKKIHNLCQKKTGVAEELIRQGHDGNIPDDPVLKCYLHCLFDSVSLIDGDNTVHLEHLKEVMPQEAHEVINNLINKCGTKMGTDGCDTAYQTLKCYFVADKASMMTAFGFLFD